MKNNDEEQQPELEAAEKELLNRRNFLRGLGKWSLAVIGGVALGGAITPNEISGWVNRRGSCATWINGGGGWINRGGTWINGGGGWVNRTGGGGSWVNRRGW